MSGTPSASNSTPPATTTLHHQLHHSTAHQRPPPPQTALVHPSSQQIPQAISSNQRVAMPVVGPSTAFYDPSTGLSQHELPGSYEHFMRYTRQQQHQQQQTQYVRALQQHMARSGQAASVGAVTAAAVGTGMNMSGVYDIVPEFSAGAADGRPTADFVAFDDRTQGVLDFDYVTHQAQHQFAVAYQAQEDQLTQQPQAEDFTFNFNPDPEFVQQTSTGYATHASQQPQPQPQQQQQFISSPSVSDFQYTAAPAVVPPSQRNSAPSTSAGHVSSAGVSQAPVTQRQQHQQHQQQHGHSHAAAPQPSYSTDLSLDYSTPTAPSSAGCATSSLSEPTSNTVLGSSQQQKQQEQQQQYQVPQVLPRTHQAPVQSQPHTRRNATNSGKSQKSQSTVTGERFKQWSAPIPTPPSSSNSKERTEGSSGSSTTAVADQKRERNAANINSASSTAGTGGVNVNVTALAQSQSVQSASPRGRPHQSKNAHASTSSSSGVKRARVSVDSEAEDSEDEDEGDHGGNGGSSILFRGSDRLCGIGGLGNIEYSDMGFGITLPRPAGACTHCKRLKMRCEFPPGENECRRCKTGNHKCVVEGRKARSAPNKREYLLAQIRQKDAIIESLLKQLHNPYTATPLSIAAYKMATSPSDSTKNQNVLQWLDRLQQSVQNAPQVEPGVTRSFKIIDQPRRPMKDGLASREGDEESEDDNGCRNPGVDEEDKTGDGISRALRATDTSDVIANITNSVSETLKIEDDDNITVPINILATLSLESRANRSSSKTRQESSMSVGTGSRGPPGSPQGYEEDENNESFGIENDQYFMKGPFSDLDIRKSLIERHSPPEIIVHGLVTTDDVTKLFEIFYEKINPFLSLLDPELHTPSSTFTRCPFLFTVVCAISSRYYREKSEVYAIAMHFAKHSAATALTDGWKSVELCQAYILMAVYSTPARRWEEDRSWLYIGLAIRLATDLNLHQAYSIRPTSDRHERELLNRTRVWMICFNLDRSTATQFGKPWSVKEDFIIRGSKDWYKQSPFNHKYDVHLCAYSSLLRIVAKFHESVYSDLDSPNGLNQNADFRSITLDHDEVLESYFKEWTQKFKEDSDPEDKACKFRCSLLPFLVNYSRLVMFSFGFQQAFKRGFQPGDELFFNKCMESASNVIKTVIESLAPSGYFRYAPDGHFVFASFASAFLLKLLRPEFAHLLTQEQTNNIFGLIARLIQVLSSSEVAIDDRHTPKLYARFLAGLLAKHQPGGSSSGRLHPRQPPDGQVPQDTSSPSPSSSLGTTGASGQSVFHVSSTSTDSSPHVGASQRQGSSHSDAITHSHYYPSPLSMESTPMETTPIYEAEATYAAGGPLELSSADALGQFGVIVNGFGPSMQDDELLATMHTLKNPAWWDDMMMPGFSWPDVLMRDQPQPLQMNHLRLQSLPVNT